MMKKKCVLMSLIVLFSFLINILSSLSSYNCLNIDIKPIKEKINISDYAHFAILLQNNCKEDLKIFLKYPGYVYSIVFTPNQFLIKKGETKFVDLKIYSPSYLYSGWKALKIEFYRKNNNKKELITQKIIKFYIYPTPKEIEKKVEYRYIILTKNLDLLLNISPTVKSEINGKKPFEIIIKGINASQLKDFSLTLFVTPLNEYNKKKFKPLELEWDYINNLNKKFVKVKHSEIVFRNYLLNNLDVAPGMYRINAVLNIREKGKFDISENAENNIMIVGVPFFKVEKKCFSNFYKKECVYNIKNKGNKEGVYQLQIPVNWFNRLFINYDFEAKMVDGKLIKEVKINAKDNKIFVITYNYLPIYVILLLLTIFVGIYYYIFYYNPLQIKKEINKIGIHKNRKSFHIEIKIKNNTLKTMKDLIVLEKISNNANLNKLSIYPKGKIKEDINTTTIRWVIKELKPFSTKVLKYKIEPYDKSTVTLNPTLVKTNKKIFSGNGLKISLHEEINVEEFF